MLKQLCRSGGVAVAVVAVTMSAVGYAQTASAPSPSDVVSHSQTPPPASAAVSAWHAQFSKGWNPPKTPWGDPDMQGNFTWVDEVGTPMERPAKYEGRNLNSFTQAEMDALNLGALEQLAEADRGAGGGGATEHWYDRAGLYQKNTRPWFMLEPVDGKVPPLAPEAVPLAARPTRTAGTGANGWKPRYTATENVDPSGNPADHPNSYLDWDLDERCIIGSDGALGMFSQPHGNLGFIVQTPDYVVFQVEELLATRVIPIKGRGGEQRLSHDLRPYAGDSLAWFEGNTMVVETVYPAKAPDVFSAPPQSTRVIERYTRRTAPEGIEWTMTVENPSWWVRPWTWQQRLTEDDRQVAFEYVCHETNHSIVNSLSGARDIERRAAERAKRQAAQGGR